MLFRPLHPLACCCCSSSSSSYIDVYMVLWITDLIHLSACVNVGLLAFTPQYTVEAANQQDSTNNAAIK
jgi:hypothetical protein